MKPDNRRSHLRIVDLFALSLIGLRYRKIRSSLTILGVGIGIGAIVAIVGISQASKAEILDQIDSLGTNILSVQPADSFLGNTTHLPEAAAGRISRIPPVIAVSPVTALEAEIRRSDLFDQVNAIRVLAVDESLQETLQITIRAGTTSNFGNNALPIAVLGQTAAIRLGVTRRTIGSSVRIDGHQFQVVAIMNPVVLAPWLDTAVLVSVSSSMSILDNTSPASVVYLRTYPDRVLAVRDILAATANPTHPSEVSVQRPSEALEARGSVDRGLQTLLLGLGAISIVVGAIGVANVMVIGVLERRGEIGLRRALGAKRRHIWLQFVAESAVLSGIGGVVGVCGGVATSVAVAQSQGWDAAIPWPAVSYSLLIAIAVGVAAGIGPSFRAARINPADAVRSGV